MTTLGLIGGLGPESTIDYYRRILEEWQRIDPHSSPHIVMDSLDVDYGLSLVEHNQPKLVEYLLQSVQRLAAAGCDFAAMAANTPHVVFDELDARSPIGLLSIVEAAAEEAKRRGMERVGLLGTRFTMEGTFYPEVLARYGIECVVPDHREIKWIHERYIAQMLRGDFREETRDGVIGIILRLGNDHRIDGVILGGTELTILLSASSSVAGVPALDTTALHVRAIVKRLRE